MDPGLEAAFKYVERLLYGDSGRPGLTIYDLERLVGYPARGEGPLRGCRKRVVSLKGAS
jgi:hypothetical protein